MCFQSWAIYIAYLFFFEHQFQLISVCFEQSISEIFIMKQSCGDHFASVELCSIYHPTIIVFWRILNISEEDAWVWPVVTVSSWQISWLLLPASVFWKFPWLNLYIRYKQTFHRSLVKAASWRIPPA